MAKLQGLLGDKILSVLFEMYKRNLCSIHLFVQLMAEMHYKKKHFQINQVY